MITILLITDPDLGLVGSFIGEFQSDSIGEARDHSATFMRGMIEDGYLESEVFCLTFADKSLSDIERDMPHIFFGEEKL